MTSFERAFSESAPFDRRAAVSDQGRLRAQLADMAGGLSPSAPQYRVAEKRVVALAAQIAAEEGRMTGSSHSMAPDSRPVYRVKLAN